MHPSARAPVAAALTILVVTTCSGPVAEWRSRIIVAPLYRPPAGAALAGIQRLFEDTLRDSAARPQIQAWQAFGFVAEWRAMGEGRYLLVREAADRIEGKGRYMLRPGAAIAVALQAPHADTDLHTGEIAERLFLEAPIVAAAFNTLPRWAVDARGGPADLAHRADSVLFVFSRAFVERYRGGVLVQLHGFDTARRETLAGTTADVIVSGGTRESQPELVVIRDCLAASAPGRVRLYPDEVPELGGTQNAIGRVVRNAGAGRFLHVEMSLPFRRRLLADATARLGFVRCFAIGPGA